MQKDIIWTLKKLHLCMEQYGRMQMENIDLSPTQAVLLHYLLTHKEQELYAIDLHTKLGISKSYISSTLKELKQKGYLYMKIDPKDDRKKQIILTEKAYKAEQLIKKSIMQQQKFLCQEIPERRIDRLESDLNKMLCNLQKEIEQEATV